MNRVVVTGIGMITPIGNDRAATWSALLAGASGAAPITHFDASRFSTTFACEVKGWDPSPWFTAQEHATTDRFLELGVGAAMMAVDDAGLAGRVPEASAERWGCYVGAGLGGVRIIEDALAATRADGPDRAFAPGFVTNTISNALPGAVSARTGATGPSLSIAAACATSAHAIGEAARLIRHGYADGMIAGGAEATIEVLGVGGFCAMRALSTRNDAPTAASRPFDRERDGFVIGEGAGVVVLEELGHARRRGARIYAELVGYAATADAYHVAAPPPDHTGVQRCLRAALRDARLTATDIGYINAHGTSTPLNDKYETSAIRQVFGDHARRLAISSTKSMMGHTMGAAGGIEAAITALALDTGVLPPTINYATPDPECDLDYVPNCPRAHPVDYAVSNSFGFGGTNAVLALGRYRGD